MCLPFCYRGHCGRVTKGHEKGDKKKVRGWLVGVCYHTSQGHVSLLKQRCVGNKGGLSLPCFALLCVHLSHIFYSDYVLSSALESLSVR